jgi:cobalt-zinc-cadmium efflux system outer membrane protein
MSIKRIYLCWLLAAGCSPASTQPALDRLHADISARSAVPVDWGVEAKGSEAISRVVAELLSGEMTADDAVAVSLLKNPSLWALYRDLGVAQSDMTTAGLPESPVFSTERRFRGRAAEFDVAQEFISLILIPLRRRQAASQFDRDRLRITHEVINHTAEVRGAYFRAQAAGQVVELRQEVVAAMDGALEAAKALRAAGNTAAIDLAVAERGANQARLDLVDAELEVVTTRERLNVLLGLWGEETGWQIPKRLPEPPAETLQVGDLERLAVSGRLDLASLRAEIESSAQSKALTRVTSVLPELTIGAHSEREPEGDTTRGPSLEFPLSLFGRGQAARARSGYLLLQAEDRFAALAIEVRSEVRMAFARMETARKKAEFYRRAVLPVQQIVTDETQLRYNGMFVGVFQLLEARQEQINSGREYIESIAEYWLARAELERVIGRRLVKETSPAASAGRPEQEPRMHQHD